MCKVQQHDATSEENEENISQATLIWRAIKLPIYSVALVPLTVSFEVINCRVSFRVLTFSTRYVV